MTQVDLQYGAATHTGLVRESNEDALLATPPVFVVADGMGGHDHGEVASGFVVAEFARLAQEGVDAATAADALTRTFTAVHDRIEEYDAAHHAAGELLFGSGSTAVAAVLVTDVAAPYWLLANLGDSRGYRFTGSELAQVTVDHSLVQEMVDDGTLDAAEAAGHPDRHIVTRALGGPMRYGPDFFLLPADEPARILLCSDGVSGMLAHDEIARILREHEDPGAAADEVVAAAVAAGGHDNATAVVVDVVGLARQKPHETVRPTTSKQETGAHP